jgi:predicted NAD/FAD-dependent oxidoreductase
MTRIAIIGAGMAGLACAQALRAFGHAPVLFDKGRGPGGRMATRRIATPAGEAMFDHGAQYFTARDPAFQAQVAAWAADGVVAHWPAAGADAFVGTPGMNAPVKALAQACDVQWLVRVDALRRADNGWRLQGDGLDAGPFDTVLLAVPSENAAPLLQAWSPAMAARAVATPALPCWTVMAAFAGRVDFAADVIRDQGAVGWAARNSAKPGRTGPEAWVIQAGPEWSAAHLEETPDAVVPQLLGAFADCVGGALPDMVAAVAHRWRYARSGAAGDGLLWDAGLKLGVCGDWLLGPRVELAWLSGTRLAGVAA